MIGVLREMIDQSEAARLRTTEAPGLPDARPRRFEVYERSA